MDANLVYLVGGLMSSLGLGFALGKSIKAIRQFFGYV